MKNVLVALATSMALSSSALAVQIEEMNFTPADGMIGQLGESFNFRTNSIIHNQCVNGNTVSLGKPVANLDFSMSVDNSQLRNSLGLHADAKTVVSAGEISGAATFLKSSSQDSTSITLNYAGKIQFTNQMLSAPALTPDQGQRWAKLTLQQFEDNCGQGYIQQYSRGARLFFSIHFAFASAEDKNSFATELHYNTPMSSVNLSGFVNNESLEKHASVKISAFQIGGKVEKLAYIFKKHAAISPSPTPTDNKKDEKAVVTVSDDGTFASIECAFGHMDQCKVALSDAMFYATDKTDVTAFPNQINSGAGQDESLFAVLDYHITPYHFPDLEALKIPGLDASIEEQKRNLYEIMMENLDRLNQLDSLQSGIIKYSEDQQSEFNNARKQLNERQKKIQKVAEYCYTINARDCITKVAALNDDFSENKFDENALNPKPATFAQFCNAAHAANPKLVANEIRESTNAILEILEDSKRPYSESFKKTVDWERADFLTVCGKAGDYLGTLTSLDLSYGGEKSKISTLDVLQDLTQLQTLKIRSQNIKRISGLDKLSALTSLDLSYNSINDLAPLSKNVELQELDVERNFIRDLTPIAMLPNLEALDARANAPTVKCFSSPVLKHCYLEKSKWAVMFTPSRNESGLAFMLPSTVNFSSGSVVIGGQASYHTPVTFYPLSDESSNTAQIGGDLRYMHALAASQAVSDKYALITGGWPTTSLRSMEVYDLQAQRSISGGVLTMGRAGHTLSPLPDGRYIAAGGYTSEVNDQLSFDNVNANAEIIRISGEGPVVDRVLQLKDARAGHTATVLADGNILFVGGFVNKKGLSTMELFEPSSGKSRIVGRLRNSRGGHTATLIDHGHLFIAGGFADAATPLATAEIVDLSTFSSRLIDAKMHTARGMHSAIALPDGEILLIGGLTKIERTPNPKDSDGSKVTTPTSGTAGSSSTPAPTSTPAPSNNPAGTDNTDVTGLMNLKILPTAIDFKSNSASICKDCSSSAEIYLPSDQSFVETESMLEHPRAYMAVLPPVSDGGGISTTIFGGLDAAAASSTEKLNVTDDLF